ncbi:MAG: penicillin-binding protein 2 [Candidatus Moranbacteria bacterium]|nr:penicillin-binding protein 2 [Candidatus Moranbacteria bacterium]
MFGKISKQSMGEIDDAVLTVTEKDAAKLEWALDRRWAGRYFIVAFVALAVLFGRAVYLNVLQGEKYRDIAKRQSIRMIPVPASRGIIYDRFGEPLVRNIPSIGAALIPLDVPKDDSDRAALRDTVVSVLGVGSETFDAAIAAGSKNPLSPVLLKERLSQEEVILFLSRQKDFSGVSLFKLAYREYQESVMFSHILGYEGRISESELSDDPDYLPTDMVGKQGLEKSYETELRGVRGYERTEVDSLGRPKKELGITSPIPGSDLFLNIDAELQKKSYDTLSGFLETRNLERGAVIALDPRDGAVLALVSIPSFDNNLFADGISGDAYRLLVEDASKPLFNRAIAGEYPPGSTFKPVIASAALAEGVVSEHTRIESKGGISVGSFFFGDWKAHGFTDIRRAIAVSSDVFFYSVGGGYGGIPGLGIRRMKSYAEKFGYGSPSGIDIPGEGDGLLPDPEWKERKFDERWYVGDDYHAAIGQGFVTATPLQVVNSIAAIANGGTLYVPRVVSHIRNPDGSVSVRKPRAIREHIVDSDIIRIVREGMRQTVTEGTAMPLNDLAFPVAGKTGTAQFGTAEKTHGWFVSFAPFDDPKIAMIVLIEDQKTETYNAVPVTKEIYGWYFRNRLESDVLGE